MTKSQSCHPPHNQHSRIIVILANIVGDLLLRYVLIQVLKEIVHLIDGRSYPACGNVDISHTGRKFTRTIEGTMHG